MRATRKRVTADWQRVDWQEPVKIHALFNHSLDSEASTVVLPAQFEPARPVSESYRKRAFDFVMGSLALLFFAPFMAFCALLIVLETGGPVFFRQMRTGYRGQTFMIFKFRTMRVEEDGAAARQATRDDDRVTRVGLLLRKLSLDELPQLLNVVRGEMSLIGPRPHAVGHDLQFSRWVPGYDSRFQARPGLTGLAQINGYRGEIHSIQCIRERVTADVEYIDRWSFSLDMKILLRTLPLLLGDPRAY